MKTGRQIGANQIKKPRIALWTPLPPLKTGIAQYVADLLPGIDKKFDLEIFVDHGYRVSEEITQKYKVFNYLSYDARVAQAPFDLNIYQMGNNTFHVYLYKQALRVPGLVVQHDLSLSYILYHYLVGISNNYRAFVAELQYSEGPVGSPTFISLYNSGNEEELMSFFSEHYMLRRLSERSYGFLTHLEYCANTIKEKYGAQNTYSMYLGSPDPFEAYPHINQEIARRALDIQKDTFVIGVFGFLQPTKQIEVVIRAVEKALKHHKNILLVFVGELNPSGGYDRHIRQLVSKLALGERIRFTGYISNEMMQHYYVAVDVVVNLRFPSFGEMSATLSRGIATGKPAIVTDLPEWRFLPGTFCWFVPPSDLKGEILAAKIIELIKNPDLVQKRGAAARQFYLAEGTTAKAADNLASVVDKVLSAKHNIRLSEVEMVSALDLETHENRAETVFINWDQTRAGGWRRQQAQKLKVIPLLGPLIWAGYRLVENALAIPQTRKAEWRMFKTFSEEIKNYSIMSEQAFRVASEVNEAKEELQQSVDAIKRTTQEFTDVYKMPKFRFVKNFDHLLPSMDFAQKKSEMSEDEYYKVFQDVFRGSEKVIKHRQAKIVRYIVKHYPDINKPIVDIGCGRGEFLDLLKENGLKAIGVEINKNEVKALKEKGHEVYLDSGQDFLEKQNPESLSGIAALHLLEHMPESEALKLLELAWDKLIVGGLIYVETPNPLNRESLSSFYTDPTHVRPIQPFQMAFWLKVSGFCEINAFFQEPVPTFGSISEQKWITLYQDYGLIAKKCR